ncbi:MAG: TolC family protein [Candidatus Krumholzibacteriota bacterium]|nr:TolC family protein [Candidatus Krumholzibacteriota bacterium]
MQALTTPSGRERRAARRLAAGLLALVLAAAAASAESPQTRSLDMAETVRLALDRNLGLMARRAELSASVWETRSSYLAYLPTGALSSSVTRVDDRSLDQANQAAQGFSGLFELLALDPDLAPYLAGMGEMSIDPFLYRDTYRTSVTVNQEFPLNVHLLGGSKLARAGERAAREGFLAERDQVVLAARRAYFQLLAVRELVQVAKEGVASAENRQLLARDREELGMISRSESLRWEVALAEARSQLTAANNAAALAEMGLNQLLDQDLRTPLVLAPAGEAAVAWGARLAESDPEDLARRVIAASPAARLIRAGSDAAAAGKLLAFSGLTPSLHFSLSYGWKENDTVDLDGYDSWSATAALQVPLFDLGRSLAGYRKAAAQQRRSEYAARDAVEGLRLNVYAAWREVRRAREDLRHREKAAAQAKETFDLMQDRYELGHVSEFDLVDVQAAWTAARAQAVAARYDVFIALAALESLLGGENRIADRQGGDRD